MSEWKFPDVALGDDVLVASDPSRSDRTYAKVTRVLTDAQTIDAVAHMPRGGTRFFFQCWHRNDPRIVASPDRFHDASSGVFELTEDQIRRKAVGSDWQALRDAITDRMDALEQRLATLDRAIDKLTPPAAPVNEPEYSLPPIKQMRPASEISQHRGPGRPRKVAPVEDKELTAVG